MRPGGRGLFLGVLSNTPEDGFYLDASEDALVRYEQPDIFNTDEGCQFTSKSFTGLLEVCGIRINMDGRGRWLDRIFIERLWRSMKYDCVFLHAFDSSREAKERIGAWLTYYNQERPHSSLEDRTPDEAYRGVAPLVQASYPMLSGFHLNHAADMSNDRDHLCREFPESSFIRKEWIIETSGH